MAAQLLDYAADAPGIVTSGGLVTSLPDAAHALVATPVAGYSGPELTTTTINGVNRAALRFDGTDSWLESSGSINVPPVGSLALVMNLSGPNPDPYVNRPVGWEDPAQGATGLSILATTPGAGVLVIARGVGIGDVSLQPSMGADYEIVVATWGPGGTTLSRTSTANVTAQAINPAPGTILPSAGVSTLHIGGSGLQPVGRPNLWSGDILHVQAYDNQLSAGEITSLTASLYGRWFAPVPEPSSLLLGAFVLTIPGLFFRTHRRRMK
jgi:hypothetical protein